ncbi:MAG: alpha/beta hydrolase [Verrucomicrobiota bacterium]
MISLLNVVRAPAWAPWRLAVVTGEYGHWFAPAAISLAVLVWFLRDQGAAWCGAALLLCGVATALLLKPVYDARRIAAALPAQLAVQFPAGAAPAEPFDIRLLYSVEAPATATVTKQAISPRLPFDLYRPAGIPAARPLPCVVMIHGGGWESGDRGQLAHFNHWLAGEGWAVAAISYRLAPAYPWPAQRDDVLAAVAHLKAHAGELGLDPTRLVLMGRSAGGQLAQVIGYTAVDPAIRGVIALYAPSDLIFGYVNTVEDDMLKSPALMRRFLGGTPESARPAYESASALFHVTRRSPPTLLLHGTNDALVWHRHSQRLDAKLAEAGVPRVLLELPWATHGFEYNLHGPGGQLTTYAVAWFLAAVRDGNYKFGDHGHR